MLETSIGKVHLQQQPGN